jgi:hypothetical protein
MCVHCLHLIHPPTPSPPPLRQNLFCPPVLWFCWRKTQKIKQETLHFASLR